MGKPEHGIVCFETEWLHNNGDKRFNLQTNSLLQFLKDFYDCDIIHKTILTKRDLEYYIEYFSKKKYMIKYDIIYFATHGLSGNIILEGETCEEKDKIKKEEAKYLHLSDLATMANGSFGKAIIHFSSCETFKDKVAIQKFKEDTGAAVICGYTKSVDPIKSAILDIALFNYLMHIQNVGILLNKDKCIFWKTYAPLIKELGFDVI